MNDKKINKTAHKLRVLVAPLDWGLGHATRCIPIIQLLISRNIEVIIAADGAGASLLTKEFPSLTILPLKGYKITYGTQKNWFFIKMLLQFPKIAAVIKYEKNWLKNVVKDHQLDAVISDNRFGLQHTGIISIYITHQLFIETGNIILDKIAQKIHYRFINRYDECWVPDAEGNINLAGKLSHPEIKPQVPVKYLGSLSRFKKVDIPKENDLLIMLSGPEPQRTIFESILLKQIKQLDLLTVIVRGLPAEKEEVIIFEGGIKMFNHLPAEKLAILIQQSDLILARAGYSTIMDLVALGKIAVLVPTPGQTEQEYLAKYLKDKKLFFTADQHNFLLKEVLDEVAAFNFTQVVALPSTLKKQIDELLEKINIKASQ
ncbi:MAG: glycosyltransferase [Ferruginibacter sp.]